MKRYFYLVLALIILNGCVSTGKVALVSPTTPEEELKDKVRETLDESKKPSESRSGNSESSRAVVLVSPTTPEEELKDKVRETLDKSRKPSEPGSDNSQSPPAEKTSGMAADQPVPAEDTHQAVEVDRLNALINLLEKKGVINRNELMKEIKRLEEQGK